MIRRLSAPTNRRLALIACAWLLLLAQTLGLAHRVLHGSHGSSAGTVVAAEAAPAAHHHHHGWFDHDDGDGPQCQLYDHLAAGDLLTAAVAAVATLPPVPVPAAFHAAWQLATQAAGFLARGPPTLR